ncbi:MAG: DUF3500 domain-containing protein [Kiloniellales bacterium]
MRLRVGLVILLFLLPLATAKAHEGSPVTAAAAFLASLDEAQKSAVSHPFEDRQRFAFRWTPGKRAGVPLQDLSPASREELRHLLTMILSERGALTLDAILATEAALGVIEGRPGYRNPELYYTAIFGTPGAEAWGLRFEGHHLSINITFAGERPVSGTPLFLGTNPETIPDGPDKGLRAMAPQVDLAWNLYSRLDQAQVAQARNKGPGYGGFLTRAGSLRAPDSPPVGIAWQDLNEAQQALLLALAVSYIGTLAEDLSRPTMAALIAEEAPQLHFFWEGAEEKGGAYYYRIAGPRLFIEHNAVSGGTHIHAIWRDRDSDWGGLQ